MSEKAFHSESSLSSPFTKPKDLCPPTPILPTTNAQAHLQSLHLTNNGITTISHSLVQGDIPIQMERIYLLKTSKHLCASPESCHKDSHKNQDPGSELKPIKSHFHAFQQAAASILLPVGAADES